MAKRPGTEPPEEEILKKNNGRDDAERAGLGRREFVKLAGTASVAVGVLASEGLLKAEPEPQEAPDAATTKLIGPGPVKMTLRINGKPTVLVAEPRVTLLDALRDRVYLTGAKKVCDRATCGACTVIIDGKPVYSCTTLAIDAQGRAITTIEGIAEEGHLHEVSQAFVNNDAQQCGFCTPGFVMACKSYLDSEKNPTYEGVQKALGGNLCRCGTYMGIRHAVLEAAKGGA